MADERSASVSASSASSLPLEVARLASDEDVAARRKQQRSEREVQEFIQVTNTKDGVICCKSSRVVAKIRQRTCGNIA